MNDREPFFNPARVITECFEQNRRILVISDIHGNLYYLQELLKQVGFCEQDILIIDGDYMEKGPDSLGTLRFLMELYSHGNTFVLNGNCDDWERFLFEDERVDSNIIHYLKWKRSGIIYEMLCEVGGSIDDLSDFGYWRRRIYSRFKKEWDFIISRPHALETEYYIFTHAGMHAGRPLCEHKAGEIDKFDNFMASGYSFDKWIIVGHWPVVLYGTDRVCASPIIDTDHRIISIDGGCVLKDDGQLNCLIIPSYGSSDFTWESYDPFPEKTVMNHQEESSVSYYIRWGDSDVRILEKGFEFSKCQHVRTGYVMDILTKYLFTDNEITGCNDCSDYILPLEPGDKVRVIESTSRGYYVKHNGTSGWYFGALK